MLSDFEIQMQKSLCQLVEGVAMEGLLLFFFLKLSGNFFFFFFWLRSGGSGREATRYSNYSYFFF